MIYSSFVLCSGHSLGFIIFYTLGGFLFALNIYIKEEMSYKKKEGWEEYKKQSYVFLPKLFSTDLLNFAFHASALIGVIYFFALETSEHFWYPFNQLLYLWYSVLFKHAIIFLFVKTDIKVLIETLSSQLYSSLLLTILFFSLLMMIGFIIVV